MVTHFLYREIFLFHLGVQIKYCDVSEKVRTFLQEEAFQVTVNEEGKCVEKVISVK